jgi:4a-hydroxytetrahydrobiopterin dehydratase
MARPSALTPDDIERWLPNHPGWERSGVGIARAYKIADFATALAVAVRVGCLAEKMDHHPDIELGWGRIRVLWSTHDAGGITQLDLDAAQGTDAIVG